jgi:rhodanese-related sulfurtransferase
MIVILLGLLFQIPSHGLAANESIISISPKNAAAIIMQNKGNSDFVILDIRTPPEYKKERLLNSVQIDYYSKSFTHRLNKLDKNKTYLVYCRSGNRSGRALSIFKSMGFKNVYNMDQGINGWRRAGYPTVQ